MSRSSPIKLPAAARVDHIAVGDVAANWSLFAAVPPEPARRSTRLIACRRNRGFTIIELIVTLILIGILAAVAIPRMNLVNSFDEVDYRDQVIATLDFARKSAVAARRYVCAERVGNTISLTIDSRPCKTSATQTGRRSSLNL